MKIHQANQPVFCNAIRNTALESIPANEWTTVPLNVLKLASEADFQLSSGSLVVKQAGIYQLSAAARLNVLANETARFVIRVQLAGTAIVTHYYSSANLAVASAPVPANFYALPADSTLAVQLFHTFSGARSLFLGNGEDSNFLSLSRVRNFI